MRTIIVLLLVALLASGAYSAPSTSNKDIKKSSPPSKGSTSSRTPTTSPPPRKEKEELCRSHIVQPGDTALSVSEKYRVDYDQMVAALEQCIGYTEGSFLTVGQSICLPPYYPSCKFVTSTDPAADECKLYTVQQGDTMASIASSFNLYIHWLVGLNGEAVQPGQRIKLPPWYSRCPSLEAATNPPCRVYNVKTGDTMYTIAAGFRTSVDELISANPGFTTNSVLSQGQPVKIPPFPATCGSGTPVSGFPTDGVTSCRAYRVEPGDSVYSIALKFATAGADIVSINPELNDPSRLAPGNAIKIPPWDDSCSEEGILVDPNAANTPTGTGTLVPGTGTSIPNPVASSPVPVVPVTATPPRQVDTGSNTRAPAPAPTLAPEPSTSVNTTAVVSQMKSKVEMLISGVSRDEFTVKQQSVINAIATAAKVPTTSVSITFVVPATSPSAGRRRKLLISSSAVKVQSLVTGDPVAVQNNLLGAQRAGTLAASFTVEGMTLDTMTMIDPFGKSTPIVTSASSGTTTGTTTNSGSSVPLPLIIGVSAGVVGLIIAITTIACCVSKSRKRRQAEQAAARLAATNASKRYAGVNAYVTTSSLRNKYSSDELKDYNGNNIKRAGSGGAGSSPHRSPHRGPGSNRSSSRHNSRQNLNNNNISAADAYVISTTVSNTPKANDVDVGAQVSSRPPSSAASAADTLVDEYQTICAPVNMVHEPTVPVVVMPPPQQQQQQYQQQQYQQQQYQQQQYQQQHQQVVAMETTGSSSPKESVAEAYSSSNTSDKGEEYYEEEQYYLAAAPAPVGHATVVDAHQQAPMVVRPLPSVRDGSFKRNPVSRAAVQPGEFSVAAVQSKSFRNSTDHTGQTPRRDLSPGTKRGGSGGYVSPYSQKVISGQVSMPRSPSRTAAGGGAGRVAAKITTTTTVGVGGGVGGSSPTRASGGYVSPYSQQKLRSPQRSPQRSPTRKSAHERLSAYAEM